MQRLTWMGYAQVENTPPYMILVPDCLLVQNWNTRSQAIALECTYCTLVHLLHTSPELKHRIATYCTLVHLLHSSAEHKALPRCATPAHLYQNPTYGFTAIENGLSPCSSTSNDFCCVSNLRVRHLRLFRLWSIFSFLLKSCCQKKVWTITLTDSNH